MLQKSTYLIETRMEVFMDEIIPNLGFTKKKNRLTWWKSGHAAQVKQERYIAGVITGGKQVHASSLYFPE